MQTHMYWHINTHTNTQTRIHTQRERELLLLSRPNRDRYTQTRKEPKNTRVYAGSQMLESCIPALVSLTLATSSIASRIMRNSASSSSSSSYKYSCMINMFIHARMGQGMYGRKRVLCSCDWRLITSYYCGDGLQHLLQKHLIMQRTTYLNTAVEKLEVRWNLTEAPLEMRCSLKEAPVSGSNISVPWLPWLPSS
jgi:hypothetical protein